VGGVYKSNDTYDILLSDNSFSIYDEKYVLKDVNGSNHCGEKSKKEIIKHLKEGEYEYTGKTLKELING
jgi:hypothetical protein